MNSREKNAYAAAKGLPLIVSGELVVFPGMVVPFFTKDKEAIDAIQTAMKEDKCVFFAFPRGREAAYNYRYNSFKGKYIYSIGTIVKVIQIFKLQNGTLRILGEAKERASISTFDMSDSVNRVFAKPVRVPLTEEKQLEEDPEIKLMMSVVKEYFAEYRKHFSKFPKEASEAVDQAEQPMQLVDLTVSNMMIDADRKIGFLQEQDIRKMLKELAVLLQTENEMHKLNGEIQQKVRERIENSQKEYFLNEQIRQINKELGREMDEADEAEELFKQIEARNPPDEVLQKARKESNRLRKLQPMAPESGVLRTYLEWLADLPWSERSDDRFDVRTAEKILDEDHYNMKKPKERILDYIAIRSIHPHLKGPILCLVGPPGTGKTSLGQSVARALGKKFIRISLGGIRDEAEIRGHRKTYVGALPGKIIQSIRKAQTVNPVFLLDEVDKLSSDFRGDPSSALLEVLDPEQNSTFSDHYLEVPYDLSQVLFIATANSLYNVPAPLRDRMEIIEIPGYSDIEKYHIAQRFLIPKQLKENGLDEASIRFQKDAVYKLIHDYTMESGVRNLERIIASVLRKIAREYLRKQNRPPLSEFTRVVTSKSISRYIGRQIITDDEVIHSDKPGIAHGLAWTETGGRLLSVETALMKGEGKLILTGNLGDVMKESARISFSYLESNAERYGIDPELFKTCDVHIHVPQGAIPKDGPSAGITLTAALASAFRKQPLRSGFSMTGEISLTGNIYPIGGIKEKLLASYRHDLFSILLPEDNQKDVEEDIPSEIVQEMHIHYISTIDEALKILLPPFEHKAS